jgi:hypothetical protein
MFDAHLPARIVVLRVRALPELSVARFLRGVVAVGEVRRIAVG